MGFLSRLRDRVRRTVDSVVSRIRQGFKDGIDKVRRTLDRVTVGIGDFMRRQIDRARGKTSDAERKIKESTAGTADKAKDKLDQAEQKIKDGARDNARKAREKTDDADRRTRDDSRKRQREAEDRAKKIEDTVKDAQEKDRSSRLFPEIGLPGLDGVKGGLQGVVTSIFRLPERLWDYLLTRFGRDQVEELRQREDEIIKGLGLEPAAFVPTPLEPTLRTFRVHGFDPLPSLSAMVGAARAQIDLAQIRGRQIIFSENPIVIPTPSDLIRFELREVFRPDIRPRLLEEPPSEDFKKWMKKHGFSDYWAESYWAAHWELPSITQGFEMFWRLRPGRVPKDLVFTEQDLMQLLKQQDVLPFYRKRLTAIAYQPITRVDIRRMRRLGVIDKEEVYQRYLDLGYSPEDARLLAEYTEKDVGEEDRAYTKTELFRLYTEGLMRPSEFRRGLKELGYTDEQIEQMYTLAERLRRRKEERGEAKRYLSLSDYERLYMAGKISEATLRDRMQRMGYAPQAILDELKLLEWIKEEGEQKKRERKRRLSLSAMTKAYQAGIISEADLRAYMAERGYPDADIEIYLRLVRRGQEVS